MVSKRKKIREINSAFFANCCFLLIDSIKRDLIRKKNDGMLEFRPKYSEKSKRRSSSVWDLFHLIFDISNENTLVNGFVRCRKCDELVTYKGPTTSQLLRHKCNLVQPTLDSFVSTKRIKFTESELSSVRDAAMEFVVKDIRPFFAVEGDGFRNLCKTLLAVGQNHRRVNSNDIERLIPHRTAIKEHVDQKANEVQKIIMEDFRKAFEYPGSFACTTDLWSDNYRHISYMCLTAHINLFENNTIRHKKYVYHVNSMDAMSKTAENIFKEITDVLQKFGVSERNMKNRIYWTTDRGGNIRAGLSQCKRMNCYAHMMNNIVERMCRDDDAKKIIKNSAALVKFMKSSGLNSKLKKSLKSYTETRWNTVYDCINSIEENYSNVLSLLYEKEKSSKNVEYVQRLTCISRQKLQDISQFLSIFKNLTNEIEGEKYVTIHRLWPAFIRINKLMEYNISDSMIIRNMKSNGRAYIASIYDDFSPTMEHKIGVFLHPMLKGLPIATNSEKEEIYSAVRLLFENERADCELMNQNIDQSVCNEYEVVNENSLFIDFITEQVPMEMTDDELQRYIDFRFQNVIRIVFYLYV